MGRYGSIDYAAYAKGGFLLGAGLLLFGALGGTIVPALVGSPGPLITQLFVDAEIVGPPWGCSRRWCSASRSR